MIRISLKSGVEKALFVIKATDPKSLRNLQYIKIDGAKMIATDGYRLHIAELDNEYAPGFYEVVKKNQKEVILELVELEKDSYPDYISVIPDLEGKDPQVETSNFTLPAKIYARMIRAMAETVTLDYIYFIDATTFPSDIYITSETGPISFKGTETLAVVMPISI